MNKLSSVTGAETIETKGVQSTVRHIRKAAVLGSGVMGSRIACHLANAGLEVLLLDIVPKDAGADKRHRNKIVDDALKSTFKAKPSSLYDSGDIRLITTGNFEDDLHRIKDCDWVVEAIIENLEIKKSLFERVDKHRKAGSFITSNTSGIPITWLAKDRSSDFKAHFFGTHFFNPPRYLKLLELIAHKETAKDVLAFFMDYGERFLGKTTVRCKDTPAFIANRIGVFSIALIFQLMKDQDLDIETIDALTGPIIGRPKSATFRTCDVVGIDTLVKVADNTYEACPDDEDRETLKVPEFIRKMVEKGLIGDKNGKGFYKKSRDDDGKRQILTLVPETLEYRPKVKPKLKIYEQLKEIDKLEKRTKTLFYDESEGGRFFSALTLRILAYAANRIPEIADHIYQVDDAIKAGFGWTLGVFETWDALGVKEVGKMIRQEDLNLPDWLEKFLKSENQNFYKNDKGQRYYYEIQSGEYKLVPGSDKRIRLHYLKGEKKIYTNSGATLHDIGDDVLCLEFHTKMNTLGGEVLSAINKSIDIATENFKGLVIGNEAENFSAGANLGMVFMLAIDQEYDELNFAVQLFQNTAMRLRYSPIPVVLGPRGLALGGGCELTMHSDSAVASAESYIGLVEVGVGVIPAGGGTKEMVLRVSDSYIKDDPEIPLLQQMFVNLATARVATSAKEAFSLRLLDAAKDTWVVNEADVLVRAKEKVLQLHSNGYTQPVQRTDIKVLGKTALGTLYAGTASFYMGNYASEHDAKVANKLAYVMCGGDLSAGSKVSEQYLLDLEREAFLSLLGEKKTLERIQAVLKTGRPIRN